MKDDIGPGDLAYAYAALYVSRLMNLLNNLEKRAQDTPVQVPLATLQMDILDALDKFQSRFEVTLSGGIEIRGQELSGPPIVDGDPA